MTIKKAYTFLALVGLAIILLGIAVGAKDFMFLLQASETRGTIVATNSTQSREIPNRPDSKMNVSINYAIASFKTEDGTVIEFDDNISVLYSLFSANQSIDVIYDKKSPKNAHIKTYYPFLAFPGMLIAFGVFWWLCLIPSYLFAKSKGIDG